MGVGEKIGTFFVQCRRVWHVLRKPTGEEFASIAKVSAIGIAGIGLIGFIISDVIKFFT